MELDWTATKTALSDARLRISSLRSAKQQSDTQHDNQFQVNAQDIACNLYVYALYIVAHTCHHKISLYCTQYHIPISVHPLQYSNHIRLRVHSPEYVHSQAPSIVHSLPHLHHGVLNTTQQECIPQRDCKRQPKALLWATCRVKQPCHDLKQVFQVCHDSFICALIVAGGIKGLGGSSALNSGSRAGAAVLETESSSSGRQAADDR